MKEHSQLQRAFIDASAGAISGAISRTVTSPLDVIKIRFQVQLEPTTSWALLHKNLYAPSKYTGMLQATKDIFREEGLPGFWRGNVPALLMVMPYTSIQFTVLHKIKTYMSGSSKAESEMTSAKNTANEIDDDACEGSLGSTEGDNSFHKEKSQLIGRKDACTSFQQKARKSYEKKADIEGAANNDVDDIKEACSGTEEGQRLSNFDSKLRAESRNIAHVQPPGQSSKRRSKKVLFGGGMID